MRTTEILLLSLANFQPYLSRYIFILYQNIREKARQRQEIEFLEAEDEVIRG